MSPAGGLGRRAGRRAAGGPQGAGGGRGRGPSPAGCRSRPSRRCQAGLRPAFRPGRGAGPPLPSCLPQSLPAPRGGARRCALADARAPGAGPAILDGALTLALPGFPAKRGSARRIGTGLLTVWNAWAGVQCTFMPRWVRRTPSGERRTMALPPACSPTQRLVIAHAVPTSDIAPRTGVLLPACSTPHSFAPGPLHPARAFGGASRFSAGPAPCPYPWLDATFSVRPV